MSSLLNDAEGKESLLPTMINKLSLHGVLASVILSMSFENFEEGILAFRPITMGRTMNSRQWRQGPIDYLMEPSTLINLNRTYKVRLDDKYTNRR